MLDFLCISLVPLIHALIGKYHVDDYMREKNLPGTFLYTGNFYENMVLRSHMKYDRELDRVEFHQPVIKETTQRKTLLSVIHVSVMLRFPLVYTQWRCSTSRKTSRQ